MRLQRLLCVLLVAVPVLAHAQIVGVALEPKAVVGDGSPVVGGATIVASPVPDTAVFLEFSGAQVRSLGQVQAPTSYLGPPSAVVVSGDGSLALVAASSRLDAEQKKFIPDHRISLIDLTAKPLRVLQTLELDASPTSLAMSPDGRMVLAMHTTADRVTVLKIEQRRARIANTLQFDKGSGPLAAAFAPDGRTVLVTRPGDHKISLHAVEASGPRMPAIRDMTGGVRPFAVSFCGRTGFAVVSHFGSGEGDADTVSLLDLAATVPRVVDTVTVGPVPEGVACSPDGRYAAAAVQRLSNRPKTHPFYSPDSAVVLLKIESGQLRRLDQAAIGAWSQGIAFLDDSRTLVAQSMAARALHRLRIENDALKEAGPPIVFDQGGPASLGVSGR